jgi:hypothetical protein
MVCAQLRATCHAQGHALAQRFVSNDRIYGNVPGLELETCD